MESSARGLAAAATVVVSDCRVRHMLRESARGQWLNESAPVLDRWLLRTPRPFRGFHSAVRTRLVHLKSTVAL